MVSNEKLYAVVRFIADDIFSEVPSNWLYKERDKIICWWPTKIKSTSSYILNRISPDKTTWESCEVEVETYCDTWEKARKIADNPTYKTTDDEALGKGRRIKFDSTKYSSSPEEYSSSPEEKKTRKENISKTNKIMKKKEHLKPIVKSCITLSPTLMLNELVDDNVIIDTNLNVIQATEASNAIPITDVQKPNLNEDKLAQILQEIIVIKEQNASIRRMHASLHLTLKSINDRLHAMEYKHVTPPEGMLYQLLEPFLPLKDLQNIADLENLVTTNDSALSQYRSFIANIGGHSAKDNIHRILRKVFSDESAKLCSWKGKKNNYAVHNLRIITEINKTVTSSHELLKEVEFEDIAAEWFRFAKQRAARKK